MTRSIVWQKGTGIWQIERRWDANHSNGRHLKGEIVGPSVLSPLVRSRFGNPLSKVNGRKI